MTAFQTSASCSPSPASAFLVSLLLAVPFAAVCTLAYVLNWGR